MFFWIFCASQVLQNGAVSSYTSNLADIQTQTRGTSKLAAGYNSSLQGVVPIVLTPVVGYFFDRFGWRMFFGELQGTMRRSSGPSADWQSRGRLCSTSSSLSCWA
jgi:hypothetical protein